MLTEGETFDSIYTISAVFKGGGMGVVYRARHNHWNIDVAIKHPRSEFLASKEQLHEFQLECATWAAIGLHPYVATC